MPSSVRLTRRVAAVQERRAEALFEASHGTAH